jgi:hypothetical protein
MHGAPEVRFLVHTDDPGRVRENVESKTGCDCETRTLADAKSHYVSYAAGHAEGIEAAPMGSIVCTMPADVVVSKEFFSSQQRHFDAGKRCIVSAATRTLNDGTIPIGASSRELLSWVCDHAHPIILNNIYGEGFSRLPAFVFFRNGTDWAMRGFHLGPIAFVKDRPLRFSKTVDWDLCSNYSRDECHVVTSNDEFSMAEISPPDRRQQSGPMPFTAADCAPWVASKASKFHWWCFGHRIQMRGDGPFNDEDFVRELDRQVNHA